MYRKLLLSLLVLSISTGMVFAVQKRITSHKMYVSPTADGGGNIYCAQHETGKSCDMLLMSEDGLTVTQITNDNMVEYAFDIFPDKTKLAVIKKSEHYDYIYVINPDGTNARSLYSTMLSIQQVKVSPDGQTIAFVAYDPKDTTAGEVIAGPKGAISAGTLFLIDVDGSNPRTLSNNVSNEPRIVANNVGIFTNFDVPGSTLTKQNVHHYESISFSPDSTEIAFIDSSHNLMTVDTAGTRLTQVITNVYFPYWLQSGQILFVSGFEMGTVNPDGTGYTVMYSTPGYAIGNISVSPDETKIAALTSSYNTGKMTISIISGGIVTDEIPITTGIFGSGISETAESPGTVFHFDWLTDTKLVYSSLVDIYTINTDGTGLTNLTQNTFLCYSLLDAKGSKILFASGSDGKGIYTMNTDGTNKMLLMTLTEDQQLSYPSLSPDGSKLLYSIADTRSGGYELMVRDTATRAVVPLEPQSLYPYYNFKWSPAGNKILFYSELDYTYYIVNPDGTNKKAILLPGDTGGNFIFSPDGSRIVFRGTLFSQQGQDGIYVTDLTNYTMAFPTSIYIPLAWKVNKILFGMEDVTEGKVYIMNSDGTGVETIDTGDYSSVKLSPDARNIAYSIDDIDTGLYIINIYDATDSGTAYANMNKVKLTDMRYPQFKWSTDGSKIVYTHSERSGELIRLFVANADGTEQYNITPEIKFFVSSFKMVPENMIVYDGDFDIWFGDLYTSVPQDYVRPEEKGEIKIVSPEGVGERGTINPDIKQPISVGFESKEDVVKEGTYIMRIFTQFGEKVYEDTKQVSSAEDQWFEWIPEDLASGIYIVHVEGPGFKLHKKIPILR